MKKLLLLFLLFSQFVYCQEKNNKLQFKPKLGLEVKSNYFFGKNYLAKGHKNPSVGFLFKMNVLEYKKFNFGFSFENTILKVSDYSIGGNIDKSNIALYNAYLSYPLAISKEITLEPNIFYGQLFLKQKNGSKNYGTQNGNDLGIGGIINYKINKTITIYSNVSYSHYFLKVNTTPEFEKYFNNSNCLSLSLGINFFLR